MIKEILILLWILIIPLVVGIRQLCSNNKEKWEEFGTSNEYMKLFLWILVGVLGVTVPIFYFPEDSTNEFRNILIGVVITFDVIIFLTYYISEYSSLHKKIITCSFVLFNFITSVLWILDNNLSNKSIAIGITLYCICGFLYTVLFDKGSKLILLDKGKKLNEKNNFISKGR